MLLDQGQAGLTMAAVAERADVAVGGLYRYFASKDALLAALQVRAVAAFDRVLERDLDGVSDHPPLDRIRAAAGAWFHFASLHPEAFELLDRSLSDPHPNLTDDEALAVEQALRPVLDKVAIVLAEAVRAGCLRPGDTATRTAVLWALVHGAAHFRKRDRLGGTTASDILEHGVEGLIAGWRT